MESGGPVQLVYETLRAEAVGESGQQTITPSWRHRWEHFGLLGLFNDQELQLPSHEPIGDVYFQASAESAQGWRNLLEIYRSVIDKSFDDNLARRPIDELTTSPSGDLRESVYSTPTETVDDPQSSYSVALSG